MHSIHRILLIAVLFFSNVVVYAQQLVLRGDYPDPSVIKVGDTYWASATTSNWAPAYPVLKSRDLINWETTSVIFPELPGWADYYFWAPELNYENGKVYVYYSAHKKNGNLCVGIASADKPEGPYKDHGPIICQEVGSIDAFPMRDENGKLHIIWKEDANSVGKPTSIWMSELNEERTALVGEKKELFKNDKQWEANLVEGVSMIRKDDYYYAFYAAAGCCGAACTYGVGVARSKSLHGPWEKYEKNPVLTHSDKWKCPGHGTPVEKDGKNYFLYHGYDAASTIYTGREGLLIEYQFTDDGWVRFLENDSQTATPIDDVQYAFDSTALSYQWQWSVFDKPDVTIKESRMFVAASDSAGAVLGHKILSGNYTATVETFPAQNASAVAGLAVIGDEKNRIGVYLDKNKVTLVQRIDGVDSILASVQKPNSTSITLRVNSKGGNRLTFSYSNDGKKFTVINKNAADATRLPPWDRALRVGVVAKGNSGSAAFDNFSIDY